MDIQTMTTMTTMNLNRSPRRSTAWWMGRGGRWMAGALFGLWTLLVFAGIGALVS